MIQLRQVGDVLLTTPVLKALRDCYPEARIDYLTEPGPSGVLEGHPLVDEIIVHKRKASLKEDLALVSRLRRSHYDLVLDLYSNPRSALFTWLSGAPRRVAGYRLGRNFWYTDTPRFHRNQGTYSPTQKLALLEAIGIPAILTPPTIQVPDSARNKISAFLGEVGIRPDALLITMDLTSRQDMKKWPGDRYIALADHLAEQHQARVVFIWGPGEREEVEGFLAHARHPHLMAPPTTLKELAALIERSSLHIGNCSGPRHIAVAVGTPSMTVMGPQLAANWTYPAPEHRFVQGKAECPACRRGVCTIHWPIEDVTVEQATETMESMFREGLVK